MAFGLLTSLSALFPAVTGALFNFSIPTTVRSIRISNTSNAARTVTLYLDYDGVGVGAVDTILPLLQLAPYESVLLDGGPWDFTTGSRISGSASLGNVVNIHITPASI